VSAKAKLVCQVCGTPLSDSGEACPVCALRGALGPQTTSLLDVGGSELRFEHYQVLKNKDGTPCELGRGAMGITYKALDVHLQCPVALKIINVRFIGDDSARRRFVREARAAASVRHPNVASVFHLGESAGNYFYAMEFVEGETLAKSIQRSGRLASDVALEIAVQVAAGLVAIEKRGLIHRDIKASNIMVGWDEGRLDTVKIIDLGLAKGVAEETISTAGGFIGTPGYASPEQFAGIGIDIRSDLYSLGITLWEMLSGKLPFQGSATELMYQHQHAPPPIEKLRNVPEPIIAVLEILLAKDPGQRFHSAAQLQKALLRVREALASGSRLSANDLRSTRDKTTGQSKRKPTNRAFRWYAVSGLCLAGLLLGWYCFSNYRGSVFDHRSAEPGATAKSIAVLPFENISANKEETYFADGVQDEILANVARISALKVISRTSVMQYRPAAKRDLRQIANALGVANILEGTVRRAGNRVRITIELVDAGSDHTIWSEIYDRDLTDIFAIQSEVAETVARKLTATLSPEEKKRIEAKPTENLQAYDLYLRAKELTLRFGVLVSMEPLEKPLSDAISLLDQAIRLDPKFTLAYCELARANGLLYVLDPSPERRPLGEAAIKSALHLQPDLPEVHLAYAYHLSYGYDDQAYGRAREQLAIAKRGLANNTEVFQIEAYMDRRQGNWEKAIKEFKEAIALDPRNTLTIRELTDTFLLSGQYKDAKQGYDRLIELLSDQPMLKVEKTWIPWMETGDDGPARLAIAALPASMADDKAVLTTRLWFALDDSDWLQAKEIIKKFKGGEDHASFAYGRRPVPAGCYSIFIARLQGENPSANPSFAEVREQLNQKVQKSPESANFLSQLAVVDALLGNKAAVSEARRAVEMLPISKDAVEGPFIAMNLAVVYTWTDEFDLAFETLVPLARMRGTPVGYFVLKQDQFWNPLRKDPRFDKLLAELEPKD
jgi:serine/threonine protein kinase/tetratricopeptide (TPR) repeat protein